MVKPSIPRRKISLALGVFLAIACAGGAAVAQSLLAGGPYGNGVLTVVGPNGFSKTVYAKNGAPALSNLGNLPDGEYTYQLSATTNQVIRLATPQNDGRRSLTTVVRKGVATSGTFRVTGGAIAVAAAASGSTDNDDQD